MDIHNIVFLSLQGIAGAVAGYITNKYAVNMLFKEYTPFKLGDKIILPFKFGGVIKNKKEQFIEEISELVERDIINGRTLKKNIKSDLFKDEIMHLIEQFYTKNLRDVFKDMKLKDIEGFSNVKDELIKIVNKSLNEDNSELIDVLINKFDFNDELTNNLINNICDDVVTSIVDELDKNSFIHDSIYELYGKASDKKIKEIINKKNVGIIKDNINNEIQLCIDNFFKDDIKIYNILEKLYEAIDVESILNRLQDNLYDKKINDFITEQDCISLSDKIYSLINSYIYSEKGNEVLDNAINQLIELIKNMDYTIYDLLPEHASSVLNNFIEDTIHKMLPYVSEWVKKNKDEFDSVIEKSIDEAIKDMDPGIKKMIVSKVRELFLDNISAKNEVVEKLTAFIEDYNLDENSLNEIGSKVLNYLKNTKISDIVLDIQNSRIVNLSDNEKIISFVKSQFNIHGKKIIYKMLLCQTDKKIKDLVKCNLYDIFNTKGIDIINKFIHNNKPVIKMKMSSIIFKYLDVDYDLILNKSIGDFTDKITVQNSCKKVSSYIKNLFASNNGALISELKEYAVKELNEIKLKEETREKIIDKLVLIIESKITELDEVKVSSIIKKYMCNSNLYKESTHVIDSFIEDNLEKSLEGKVKKTIKDNLMEFNEDEICDLAQKFMGNELKPLSLFGGILGLVAGLVFGLFFKNINIYGFYNSFAGQFLSVVLMSLIGFLTNIIAINMLFKPYNKSIVLAKIPFIRRFSLGYIPAHKENISTAIGNVIDNDLLNGRYIKNLIVTNNNIIKNTILRWIGKDNYKVLSQYIINKKRVISNKIYDVSHSYIKNNKNNISISMADNIGNISLNRLINNEDAISKICKKTNLTDRIKENTESVIENNIFSSKKIENLFTEDLKLKIENVVKTEIENTIVNKADYKLVETLFNKIIHNIKSVFICNEDKSVYDILSDDMQESIKKYVCTIAKKYIFDDLNTDIKQLLDRFICEEIEGDKTIGTVFNSKVKITIDKNLYSLSNYLIEKLKVILINNEEYIMDSVKNQINSSLGFFEKIGYAMAGGDAIVDRAVSIMVHKNMPEFINDKFYEITMLLTEGLNTNIYPIKINTLPFNIEKTKISDMIDNIFEKMNSNESLVLNIENCINNLSSVVLKSINLNNQNDLSLLLADEVKIIINQTSSSLNKNKNEIVILCNDIINSCFIEHFYNLEINKLSNNLESKDIQDTVNNICRIINLNEYIQNAVKSFIMSWCKNKSIHEKIDLNSIVKYFEEKISILINYEEVDNKYRNSVDNMTNEILNNTSHICTTNLKDNISEKVIEAAIISLGDNINKILQSLNLKDITNKEISSMDSREIHVLFLSFSGTLFKRLYIYGLFGGIFGINIWLPFIWAIKENIFNNVKEIDYLEEKNETTI